MLMHAMMLVDSDTQTTVRPAPCPLWKLTVSPAVVALAAAPLSISSKPAFVEDVVALAPSFLFIRLARTRSARAPPTAAFSMPIFQA